MYVALKHLKLSVPGEGGKAKAVSVLPGDTIPGVESWSYPIIIAHLNAQLMKWEGDKDIIPPHEQHKARGGVVLPMIYRKMRGEKVQEFNTTKAKPVALPAVQKALDPNQCVACEKVFKNTSGLKSHQRTKHPELLAGVSKDSQQPKAG